MKIPVVSISGISHLRLVAGAKVAVSIFCKEQISLLKKVLAALNDKEAEILVLALELEVYEILLEMGQTCRYINDYAERGGYKGLDERAMQLAHNWFLLPGGGEEKDITTLDGISLGSLVTWEFTYFWAEILRCLTNVRKFIDKEKPDLVINIGAPKPWGMAILLRAYEDLHADVFHAMGRSAGFKNLKVSFPFWRDMRHRVRRILNLEKVSFDVAGKTLNLTLPAWIWRPFKKVVSDIARLANPRSGPKGVTALAAGISYLGQNMLDQIIQDPAKRVIIPSKEPAINPRNKNGRIRFVRLGKYSSSEIKADGQRAGRIVRKRMKARLEDILKGLVSVDPLIKECESVRERLVYVFTERFLSLYDETQRIRILLGAEDVKIVIVSNDVTEFMKTIVTVANKVGIPSLMLLHGIQGHPIGFLPALADKLAVFGETSAAWFRSYGVLPERIEITGAPRFNIMPREEAAKLSGKVKRELGINVANKVILVATQHSNRETRFANLHWPFEDWRELFLSVWDAAQQIEGARIILKIHPADENHGLWEKWLNGLKPRVPVILLQRYPIARLLAVSDALVTGWSNVALEAAAAGVPVITANYSGDPDRVPFAANGLALGVYRPEEMAAALRSVLFDGETRGGVLQEQSKNINRFLAFHGEEAARRVDALINSILKK